MTSVGLVLGAGGVVGHAYHAGTLATIAEVTGWDPRTAAVIVGTSAGSGVGATLRAGLAAHDFAARITGEPLSPEGAGAPEGHGAAAATAHAPARGWADAVPRGSDAPGPRSRRALAVSPREGARRARARRPRPDDGDGRSDAPAPQGAVAGRAAVDLRVAAERRRASRVRPRPRARARRRHRRRGVVRDPGLLRSGRDRR